MKTKLKKILVPFILMLLVLMITDNDTFWNIGFVHFNGGIFFILGLLFGPYGAFGASLAEALYFLPTEEPYVTLIYAVLSFGISYLAYKLWYSGFGNREITKPKLDNIYHLRIFLTSNIVCALVYMVGYTLIYDFYLNTGSGIEYAPVYFLNFVNVSMVTGIIGIWISSKIDFIDIPKKSDRQANKKLYFLILIALVITSIIFIIPMIENQIAFCVEFIIILILLYAYLTRPINGDANLRDEETILEKIIRIFLFTIIAITFIGIIITFLGHTNDFIIIKALNESYESTRLWVLSDLIIILFSIPGILILRYVNRRLTKPLSAFSEIEEFIKEDEKIEAESLLDIYSNYIEDDDEIGKLARSYTDLVNHNNYYIENIHKIEVERERIDAELSIATRIQKSNLPTEPIDTEDFIVNGYSKPAKEVGGDFFDYHILDDDNIAIVIGDASGKGVPAAILAMISQVLTKESLKNYRSPSVVLRSLNKRLCKNNTQNMFITLWLGIYNKNTNKLIFSNAGHNPPLIKENGEFRYLDMHKGLVLGIMKDYEYVDEEIELREELVIYTDGITDAHNEDFDIYGETRLLNFFNEFKEDEEIIEPLINDIEQFVGDIEQFDDMTLVYLKLKNK